MAGRAYLEYNGRKYYLGTITKFSRNITKQTSITPVVNKGMQRAFPVESSNAQTLTIDFTRKNPDNGMTSGTDSTKWTNAYWYTQMTSIVDRWQARTDGFMLYYEDDDTGNFPSFSVGGYVKTLSRVYSNSFNEVISGSLTFVVGRMRLNYSNSIPSAAKSLDSMYIVLSDASGTSFTNYLYVGDATESNVVSLISSVSITGGSESPFEEVVIRIPKRKLKKMYPSLKIVDGVSRVDMNFMGRHTLIVNRAKTSGNTVTIRAYCEAQLYEATSTSSDITGTPLSVLKNLMTVRSTLPVFSSNNVTGAKGFVTNVTDSSSTLTIPANTRIWDAMTVCAYLLHAKLFFADNNLYLIDYRSEKMSSSSEICKYIPSIRPCEHPGLVGEVSVDEEGADPIVNKVIVKCAAPVETGETFEDNDGKIWSVSRFEGPNTDAEAVFADEASISTFGEYAETVYVPYLYEGAAVTKGEEKIIDPETGEEETIVVAKETEYSQGTVFAEAYAEYLTEPQRSVSFKVKEAYAKQGTEGTYWLSYLGPSARTDEIYDEVSDETVDNSSTKKGNTGTRVTQKLVLSSYTREYPACTCKYTFGTIANIDLSSYISKTGTSINS